MKYSYYIVQTSPDLFLRRDGADGGYYEGRGTEEAERFTLPQAARSAFRTACKTIDITDGWGRRFPRIIKVSVETRTIKERR